MASDPHYGGNTLPEISKEEHDHDNYAKRVVIVGGGSGQATVTLGGTPTVFIGTPTLFAVVNTGGGAANVTLNPGPNQIGSVTVSNPITIGNTPTVFVGTATLFAVVNTSAPGVTNSMVTLFPGPNQIGSVTISHPVSLAGNVTISDSKLYIGLTTSTLGVGNQYIGLASVNIGGTLPALSAGIAGIGFSTVFNATAWPDPKTYIGLTTSTLGAGVSFIGIVTVANPVTSMPIVGNVTLSDAKTYIGLTTTTLGVGSQYVGLVSVNIGGTLPALSAGIAGIGFSTVFNATAWPDPKTYIGLATVTLDNARGVGVIGNVTLSDAKTYIGLTTSTLGIGTTFIGLVTAVTRNAGTNKSLTHLPITLSTSSIATIAIPTNANTMYITSLLLNSDATVRVNIKSGVTYLTGNASLGITLSPLGGWAETGGPDSPVWIGMPSGAIVIEKFDTTAIKANIGGKLIYFQE